MCHQVFALTIFVNVLSAAALTAGCGETSPSGPTPSAPSATALRVTAISPDLGSSDGLAEIRVAGYGFKSGATLALGGVPANVTSVADTTITAMTPVHGPGTVDLVVTNPGGESASLTGHYTFEVIALTASSNLVMPGDQLTLDWVGPSGRSCNGGGDWIAIYPIGASDFTGAPNGHSDFWYTYVCGATAGVSTATAPNQSGQYEFRFMIGDTSVARSRPVTVSAPASPSIAAVHGRET